MKVAIVLDNKSQIESWQLKIVEHLKSSKSYKLELIIETNSSSKCKYPLFSLQRKIENIIFNFKEENSNLISDIDTIFSDIDRSKIESYSLDLIIDLSCTINKELSSFATHGVWSLYFCNKTYNYKMASIDTIVKMKPLIEVELLSIKNGETLYIDSAKFNRNFSFVNSNKMALEGSTALLIKYLNILKSENIELKSYQHTNIAETFGTMDILKYLLNFYTTLSYKVYKKIAYKLFKTRYDCWSLFIYRGNFIETESSNLKPIIPPKDEFWADPFLFKYKQKSYLFFENYSYSKAIGKISCGIVEGDRIVDVIDVLTKDYHLSYPFIYSDSSGIFMIPETSENRRLEVYKCVNFPDKWELYSTAFEGETIFDTTIYRDKNNQMWLFTNKQSTPNSPVDSELYIYKIDSLKLTHIEPHLKNPVIINSEVARNGGNIFRNNGDIFRPSQSNIDGIYGKSLNINKIITLNLKEYKEKRVEVIEPMFDSGLIATHHLSQIDDISVVDATYKKL